MKSIDSIQSRLLDIELPNPPPDVIDYTSPLVITISGLLLTALLISIFFSKKFKQKRLLTKLKENLSSSLVTPKDATYILAEIIRSSHQTKRLIASDKYPQEWNDFVSRLSDGRYEAGEKGKQEIIKLIDDASSWLKAPQS